MSNTARLKRNFGPPVFDSIAADYDRMIDWDQRLSREIPLIDAIWRRHLVESLVDFGCGTGRHAIELRKLGYRVAGVDNSREMLDIAQRNADGMGIRFAESLGELRGRYDVVMSIGNTLASIRTVPELQAVLRAMRRLMGYGGVVLLQVRNYESLKAGSVVTLGLRDTPEAIYFRAYHLGAVARHAHMVDLQAFKLERGEGKLQASGTVSRVRAWSRAELRRQLRHTGYRLIGTYSDYALAAFSPRSPDIVVMARC
ncbi:MAG: class I SAM-dependent methyltransferase [Acidobacteriota bacterium]